MLQAFHMSDAVRRSLLSVTLAAAFMFSGTASQAADLRIGLKEVPGTIDPHFITNPPDFAVNMMVFEPMLRRDNDSRPEPWLAESWQVVDDTTWIFKLRAGVKWHDGSPFTAEDVKFTYTRARNVPNSPSSFATYLRQIKTVDVVDPLTLKIVTDGPVPALLEKLAYVLIVSKKHGEGASTEDYHSGKVMVGTGPYKYVSWTPNDSTVLAKNADYWGAKQPWDKVTYKIMTTDAARVAALLAGDIDVAEAVPSQEVARLKTNPDISITNRRTARVALIAMDVTSALDGGVTGPNGEKLEKNPFADPRVREAMRYAIDRDAFVTRIYEGEATATGQYLPEGVPGASKTLGAPKSDPDRAKRLMEEAGWAGKLKVELTVATGYFPQSVAAAEAVAQSWTRIGMPTTVNAVPYAIYLRARNERKLAVSLNAFSNSGGSADNFFPTMMHTRDTKAGWGVLNFAYYSNPEVDKRIEEGVQQMNEPRRIKVFEEATELAVADNVIFPLWHFSAIHGTRKGFSLVPRADGLIIATNVGQR